MRLRLPLPQGFRLKALASTTAPSRSERPPRAHIWGAIPESGGVAAHRALGGAPPASASIRPCARGFRTEPGSVRAPASILSGTDFHIEPHAEFRAGFRPNPARTLAPNLTRIHVAVSSIFWQHLCETYYKLPYPLSNLFHGQA